jgi:hypothetical protein
VEKCCTAGNTTDDSTSIIGPMHSVFWINKAANKHSEFVIGLLIGFSAATVAT